MGDALWDEAPHLKAKQLGEARSVSGSNAISTVFAYLCQNNFQNKSIKPLSSSRPPSNVPFTSDWETPEKRGEQGGKKQYISQQVSSWTIAMIALQWSTNCIIKWCGSDILLRKDWGLPYEFQPLYFHNIYICLSLVWKQNLVSWISTKLTYHYKELICKLWVTYACKVYSKYNTVVLFK